jgi:hypothetical protein
MKKIDHLEDLHANGRIILKWKSVDWNHLAVYADKLRAIVNFGCIKMREIS